MDLNSYIRAERANKYYSAKIKKEQTEMVGWIAKGLKLTPPLHITFNWFCKNKRKDPDNIAFAKKFILDGLVMVGVLTNDGWGEIAGFTDVFKVDKKNPRVEIHFKR